MKKKENTTTNTSRPPVVVVMGHIDHGKSTLLDYIRKSNVVLTEAGGITQHISAYEVVHTGRDKESRTITFLDTPGHEAFGLMRSRSAKVADVAILVVSAEDGVKTQTLEAIKAIADSSIPYVVAINKIDKPNADVQKTKSALIENEIYLEDMGGNVPHIAISSKTGEGIPELLDLVLLASDLEELSGEASLPATGVVVESSIDPKKGVGATLIIKNGSMKTGMYVVVEDAVAPLRRIETFKGDVVKEASFSSPVHIIGWNKPPKIGATFNTYASKKEAERVHIAKKEISGDVKNESKDPEENHIVLPLIIKADVLGSLDAIDHELEKIQSDRVVIRVVQRGVGDISESDIKAIGGRDNAVIIGFNVSLTENLREQAKRAGVAIATFNVIYELAEWLTKVVKERAPKIETEEITGSAKILKLFSSSKDKHVIGARVSEGSISMGERVKIVRRGTEVGQGRITNLQKGKVKVDRALLDEEFGAEIQSKIGCAQGDVLECFKTVTK